MDEEDEFFGPQDSEAGHIDPSNSTEKLSQKLYNDGYRFGKTSEEERRIQERFDIAFQAGMHIGRVCGGLYGKLQALTTDNKVLEYIANDFPESFCRDKAQSLLKIRDILGSILIDKPECSTILDDFFDRIEEVPSLTSLTPT